MAHAHNKWQNRILILLIVIVVAIVFFFFILETRDDSATKSGLGEEGWSFSAFGTNIDLSNNGYQGNFNDANGVTIYSENGAGKIVPGSTDGLAFYYTTVDPENDNFTLTATITVDSWTYSNGQEGFGMMVADAVDENGNNTSFWNNAYQLVVSKFEYYYDTKTNQVTTDTTADKICMKLGIGTLYNPVPVTEEDITKIQSGEASTPANWGEGRVYDTLESSCGSFGSGTYNIVGDCTNQNALDGNQSDLINSFVMQIKRNNTGYYLTYLDEKGEEIGNKLFYDLERNALTKIDPDHIYVGFFASRNARITVTNVEFTTVNPNEDAAAEERQFDYLVPNAMFTSSDYSNTSKYELAYYGNMDGTLIITDDEGDEILNKHVSANTNVTQNVSLAYGDNTFKGSFTPDSDYMPSEYTYLSSYDTINFKITVSYEAYNSQYLYIGSEGQSTASGTRNDPMDIYTAVKIINPGQTIVILDGTYDLTDTIIIERGIDGTKDEPIYLIADPEGNSRPVFDFSGNCAGMVLAGDYWYFSGFAVTNSRNGESGIRLSGNYNTIDNVWSYKNGNSGIEISQYKESDGRDLWPHDNLVLNCTSFLNADSGYEDADGFAARTTVGDNNEFDGCIATYNADDGFDLYAKVQYGSIGIVTIRNSVAFKNGYDIIDGEEIVAGDGNGFKMGGENVSGAHKLINCVSFLNRNSGITSNNGPDIQVYHSTAFDNESVNLAFSSNMALDTAYVADGVLSYRSKNGNGDSINPAGSQNIKDIESETDYYYHYYDRSNKSKNVSGQAVSDDWFVSVNSEDAINTGISRNDTCTINMDGFLVLTEVAPDGVGARITGTPSKKFTIIE